MMCFSACSNEAEEILTQESEIKLTSEITPSRAASDLQSTQIVAGQQVGVTITGAKSEHNNVAWTAQADGTLINTGDAIYYGNGTATIIAYHPYDLSLQGNYNEIEVKQDQSTDAGYLASDFLFTKKENVSKTDDEVALTFTHKLAKINVTLTKGDGISDLAGAVIKICGTKIYAGFNQSNEAIIPGGVNYVGRENTFNITAGTTTSANYTVSAIIIPQDVAAGTKFIKVELNGKNYYYTLPQLTTFESGKSYSYTLKVSNGTELNNIMQSIAPWDNTDIPESTVEDEAIKTITLSAAGTLSDYITEEERLFITDLKIIGNINGTDIKLLRYMAGKDDGVIETGGKLTYLDLSDANIVEGGEEYYADGSTEANVIGCNMFSELILENLILPKSITTIQAFSFDYCVALNSITIPASVTTIEPKAFSNNRFKSILVEEGNNSFVSEDGVLFNKDKTSLICYPFYKEGTEYSIPEGVTTIYGGAFLMCLLEKITIPSSVEEIEPHSFYVTTLLKEIHCKASNVPVATSSFILPSSVNVSDVTLYVPIGTKDTYAVTEGWKVFTNIVEE